MSFHVTRAVWAHSRAKGVAKYVLLAMADRARDDGRVWAGVDRLTDDTGLGRSTVQRALRALVELDELVVASPGGGRHKTATYFITATARASEQPPQTVSERHPFTDEKGVRAGRKGVSEREKGVRAGRKGVALTPEPIRNQLLPGTGEGTSLAAHARGHGDNAAPASNKTLPPERLEPTTADYAVGRTVGLSPAEVQAKTAAMLDHFRAKGERRADWHATLRTWLRNVPKFDREPRPPTVNGAITDDALDQRMERRAAMTPAERLDYARQQRRADQKGRP